MLYILEAIAKKPRTQKINEKIFLSDTDDQLHLGITVEGTTQTLSNCPTQDRNESKTERAQVQTCLSQNGNYSGKKMARNQLNKAADTWGLFIFPMKILLYHQVLSMLCNHRVLYHLKHLTILNKIMRQLFSPSKLEYKTPPSQIWDNVSKLMTVMGHNIPKQVPALIEFIL